MTPEDQALRDNIKTIHISTSQELSLTLISQNIQKLFINYQYISV